MSLEEDIWSARRAKLLAEREALSRIQFRTVVQERRILEIEGQVGEPDPLTPPEEFCSQEIRSWRQHSLRLSTAEAARIAGMSPNEWTRVESLNRMPSMDKLFRMLGAHGYRLSIERIVRGESVGGSSLVLDCREAARSESYESERCERL